MPTQRYCKHINADDLARLLDGADHLEPEVARLQRQFRNSPSKWESRIGLACILLSISIVLYMGVQFLRVAL